MNRDLFASANLRDVAVASMALVDTIQDMQPHVAMASLTATFLLLADHWKMDQKDAFQLVSNLMNHADGRRAEYKAVAAYMENEL